MEVMLKNGKWANHYDCCTECGMTEKKHKGHGICINCYQNKQYKKNPEKYLERTKKYQKENCEKKRKYQREYRIKNFEGLKRYNKKWQKENLGECRKNNKKYRENNEKYREDARALEKNKRKTDVHYKLRGNISSLIHGRLKRQSLSKNNCRTFDFLPYTVDELIKHLEDQFTEGMTWGNHGIYGWHIDHKRPDCSFDYKSVNDEEFQECWALKNLQPLWAIDNLRKGSKWDG